MSPASTGADAMIGTEGGCTLTRDTTGGAPAETHGTASASRPSARGPSQQNGSDKEC